MIREGWLLILLIVSSLGLHAQESQLVYQTFKDTRVVNNNSVEMLKQGQLDFRIGHRFGDLFGASGGWETFYGLENASDILIGAEYGITDHFLIGLHRTKGSGVLRQNITGLAKWRVFQQNHDKLPFSLVILGEMSMSTMPRSTNKGALNYFSKFAHRIAYHTDIIVGKKIGSYFSLQFLGGVTYRNLVTSQDVNVLPSAGVGARIQITKPFAVLLDGRYMFNGERNAELTYWPMLGFGLEYETGGGHVFQLNVLNSAGLMETDFIPNSTQDPLEGQFRIGFTISRLFKV